jgi:hypothetical protein
LTILKIINSPIQVVAFISLGEQLSSIFVSR